MYLMMYLLHLRVGIHIHVATQNVILTFFSQSTHPPLKKSNVKQTKLTSQWCVTLSVALLCQYSSLAMDQRRLLLCNFLSITSFFYKQSIFDHRPENCLSFSKKSPQKIVLQLLSRWSINFYCLNI